MFSWIKRPNESRAQDSTTLQKCPAAAASRSLIRELLYHAEEHERVKEWRQGAPGLSWFHKYPRLQSIISTSELQQLDILCAQVPPSHAATVLHRFREVLATNAVRPWELASVFKHVMKDTLGRKECDEKDNLSLQPAQRREMEAWASCYRKKQGFSRPTIPNCDHPREEIPTISGYVDWVTSRSSRGWAPPHYYVVPLRSTGAYSTSL